MLQYRKVSSGTRSRVSSETSPKVVRTFAHSASSATFNEVLKISCAAHIAPSTFLKRHVGLVHRHMIKAMVKINPAITLLFELYNFTAQYLN